MIIFRLDINRLLLSAILVIVIETVLKSFLQFLDTIADEFDLFVDGIGWQRNILPGAEDAVVLPARITRKTGQ